MPMNSEISFPGFQRILTILNEKCRINVKKFDVCRLKSMRIISVMEKR